jgi:methylase of polypeptide subunit release factors
MFNAKEQSGIPGTHSILLDGQKATFCFSVIQDANTANYRDFLSWSWSANVRHAVILESRRRCLVLRRWDSAEPVLERPLPDRFDVIRELFNDKIDGASAPRAIDVIHYVLGIFRQIRSILDHRDPLQTIQVLNALLIAAMRVRKKANSKHPATFQEAFEWLSKPERELCRTNELPPSVFRQSLGVLFDSLLEPEPYTGCKLHPNLLLRHAAGELYQEAHLEIERDPQAYLPGMAPLDKPHGLLPRDVRFTPMNLARALVQQALSALEQKPSSRASLDVLDPACGSGVFLQECARELSPRNCCDKVRLHGYDSSHISAGMARLCLELTKRDLQGTSLKAAISIKRAEALSEKWPLSDLILMNPPFIPIEHMNKSQDNSVRSVLGNLASGRIDVAMAFIWKALDALKEGGVLATVLPASLLSTKSGQSWRAAIQEKAELLLLSRFEGFKFFKSSLVETAFIVLRKSRPSQLPRRVKMLIAEEGFEDSALRSLRLEDSAETRREVEIFQIQSRSVQPSSWAPTRQAICRLRERLGFLQIPQLSQLFEISQGVLTGDNQVFLIGKEEHGALPQKEKRYFRPLGGQGAIRKGQLRRNRFVFFPYDERGILLTDENQLKREVRTFYVDRLLPNESKLRKRSGIKLWWELSRNVKPHRVPEPKIVSKYFGRAGDFAYDENGDYVTVQGYSWFWKADAASLTGTPLPWAYLALLNSGVFEKVLQCFCPRMLGGQFNLSKRFIAPTPLPDLSQDEQFEKAVTPSLAELGKRIHAGQLDDIKDDLTRLSARAYGIPLDLLE